MTHGRHFFCIAIWCWLATSFIWTGSGCQTTDGNFQAERADQRIVYDLAIVGGELYNGDGTSSRLVDVLVVGDTIAFIGLIDTTELQIKEIIDATGKVVSPGFIDPHAHGDPLDSGTTFTNFLAMGVTTIVLGQDGSSAISSAPNAEDYFGRLRQKPHLLNIAMMSGHGSLRSKVGVPQGRAANERERTEMALTLATDLRAGCLGLTTGLEYVPGMYADSLELIALAREVGELDGVMMSHIRSEDDSQILNSLTELGWCNHFCRTHVSHLKVTYGKGPVRAQEVLQFIRGKEADGYPMTAEVYPYSASYTGIGIVFPKWAKTPSDFTEAKKERIQELRAYLDAKIMQRNGPGATLFGTGPYAGRTLEELANQSGKTYVDILMDMGPFGASGAYFVMDDALQDMFITHPEIVICSDGSPTMRHPRGYGSFSRIIEKYVVADKGIPLSQAIHKMTGLPAQILKLPRRGLLQVGFYADILVFDPDDIHENATWKDPFQLATGMDRVFVNGKKMGSFSGSVLSHEVTQQK